LTQNVISHFYSPFRRGFRQATRGPDTGAFNHPFFRRDQPELCLEMICQRARDDKKAPSFKPEKLHTVQTKSKLNKSIVRLVSSSTDSDDKMSPFVEKMTTENVSHLDSASSTLVEDTRSIVSNSTSNSLSKIQSSPDVNDDRTMPTMVPQSNVDQRGMHICNDAAFVEACRKRRDELERLRLAKAVLYNSYMKVLHGGHN
jgi:hypothetical protein